MVTNSETNPILQYFKITAMNFFGSIEKRWIYNMMKQTRGIQTC